MFQDYIDICLKEAKYSNGLSSTSSVIASADKEMSVSLSATGTDLSLAVGYNGSQNTLLTFDFTLTSEADPSQFKAFVAAGKGNALPSPNVNLSGFTSVAITPWNEGRELSTKGFAVYRGRVILPAQALTDVSPLGIAVINLTGISGANFIHGLVRVHDKELQVLQPSK